jgi:hypothetical protein
VPLQPINEDTFVAFTDISGFKEMMKDGDRASKAMGRLYSSGYDALLDNPAVNGLFISDCGVLFSRTGDPDQKLSAMLQVVKRINESLLRHGIMLTTSIAWGHFSYHDRIEFDGIEKNPIYGSGYLAAFMDNEMGKPRIQPGECRILKKSMDELTRVVQMPYLQENATHYQYFWNVRSSDEIAEFKRRYKDSYSLKYAGMLSALRGENCA